MCIWPNLWRASWGWLGMLLMMAPPHRGFSVADSCRRGRAQRRTGRGVCQLQGAHAARDALCLLGCDEPELVAGGAFHQAWQFDLEPRTSALATHLVKNLRFDRAQLLFLYLDAGVLEREFVLAQFDRAVVQSRGLHVTCSPLLNLPLKSNIAH